jgi:hypothetical protein
MTVKKQIEIAEQIVKTGLVGKVFHSCQLLKDDQQRTLYPAYQVGAEFTYAGIDDTKGLFAYIRVNGDAQAVPLKLTSCNGAYTVTAPLRVVFFNDNEDRNQDDLTRQLMSFTFMQNVFLVRVITDRQRLVKEESHVFRETFDGKTFYVAVDINVTFILLPSDCAPEACIVYPNPVTSCPAAVPKSTESATS